MSIETRIKSIRKKNGMNQKEFAERIGIGQAGLSAIEKGIRGVTDRNISLICEKFNVNEIWLRTGEGEMFDEQAISLDAYAQQNDLNDVEIEIIKLAMSIPRDERRRIINQLKKILMDVKEEPKSQNEISATIQVSEKTDFNFDIEEEFLEAVRQEYRKEKSTALSASQNTISKKNTDKKIS